MTPMSMSERESQQVVEQVAGLAQGGLPLASGLRALAEEPGMGRLARVFRAIAQRVEQGEPLLV